MKRWWWLWAGLVLSGLLLALALRGTPEGDVRTFVQEAANATEAGVNRRDLSAVERFFVTPAEGANLAGLGQTIGQLRTFTTHLNASDQVRFTASRSKVSPFMKAVVAIGNALALPGGPTVTAGVVSALDCAIQEPLLGLMAILRRPLLPPRRSWPWIVVLGITSFRHRYSAAPQRRLRHASARSARICM